MKGERFLHIPRHLEVDGLSVARGGRLVLRGVSFGLGPGEALQVTGPNGAGKSTLLRAIAGLLPLAAGSVRWLDDAAAGETTPVGERTHYVGHADGLKSALTPRENLRFAAMLAGGPSGSAEEALERLGLAHVIDLPVAYLSAGQRRRVALARLGTAHRPLWLLDEPGTALDRAAQATLADLIAAHLAAGGMVAAATHMPLGIEARDLRLGTA